jgi:hypothetical protein
MWIRESCSASGREAGGTRARHRPGRGISICAHIIMSLCRHKKKWKDWVPLNLVVRMLTASLTDSCVRGDALGPRGGRSGCGDQT